MRVIELAEDVLAPGETALVVKTDGRFFDLAPDGSGSLGFWKLRDAIKVDRFVIHRAVKDRPYAILAGDFAGQEPSLDPKYRGKFRVKFSNLEQVGIAQNSWERFAHAGRNSIRYARRPLPQSPAEAVKFWREQGVLGSYGDPSVEPSELARVLRIQTETRA